MVSEKPDHFTVMRQYQRMPKILDLSQSLVTVSICYIDMHCPFRKLRLEKKDPISLGPTDRLM